jgi:ATP-dependent Clp protease ATP-binding subunit ClpA
MESIVDLQLNEVQQRLAEHDLAVELSEGARKWLARTGYDPAFGARPLRRAIQKFVESPLSIKILQGEFAAGDVVLVDVVEKEESVVFKRQDRGARVKVEQEVSA